MLKNSLIIIDLQIKFQKNLVSLHSYSRVIINITFFIINGSANSLNLKGFQTLGNLFLCPKISLY